MSPTDGASKGWIIAGAGLSVVAIGAVGVMALTAMNSTDTPVVGETQAAEVNTIEFRSLDGSGNNPNDPTLGQSGLIYPRIAAANYADGIGELADSPSARYLSNRIFNDIGQNVFSENGVTHWTFVWGQFIDHTIGLRDTLDGEDLLIAFDPDDPLEAFVNDLGGIATTRSAIAEGTGVDAPREQINLLSSYVDGFAIYGGTDERLDWLRAGPLDGDPTNNSATLLTAEGYLPTAAARPGEEAPEMELMGQLFGDPEEAILAGDVRANENVGLTAVQTLFVREHNRIVEQLSADLDEELKFQIARRIVSGLQQYITYQEFLPAMGVELDTYQGYDETVDPSITSEFATVGYRAHSAIHGEFEAEIPTDQLTAEDIAALEQQGVNVEVNGDVVAVGIPLTLAYGNPELLPQVGLGNLLAGLSSELAYANDEQIDNQLRSVLFQVPGPETENPIDCLDGVDLTTCFGGVNDLGALDVVRGYDHGMPTYNDLREAYGLPRATSFADLTGESTEEFPDDAEIDATNPIDDPDILDFVLLMDADGNELEPGTAESATLTVTATRRTTTAARLKGLFGDVGSVDAFTGMVSEPHVAGTEFGELQLAMWKTQFEALRDGDRFFFGNDSSLDDLATTYGIDYRRSLAEVIALNTEIGLGDLPANVFVMDDGTAVSSADSGQANEEQQRANLDSDADAGSDGGAASETDDGVDPGASADADASTDSEADADASADDRADADARADADGGADPSADDGVGADANRPRPPGADDEDGDRPRRPDRPRRDGRGPRGPRP